uniref:HAT C-terminal dimerisation domain-containing protein n=1 Tax=Nothobranchius furzeri TaxID=105023 RepID=A0A8C6L798_NOTFU
MTLLRKCGVKHLSYAHEATLRQLSTIQRVTSDETCCREKKWGKESPTTLREMTQFLDPYQDIAVVLPVSSASSEQSFSTLRLIKTYLLSAMTDKRLSSLAVLSIESKRAKSLDLEEFVKCFAEQHGSPCIQLL